MTGRKLAILGAGGHGKTVADAALANGQFDQVVYLEPDPEKFVLEHGATRCPVLAERFEHYKREDGWEFIVGVGSIGDSNLRSKLYEKGMKYGLIPAKVVHPNAVISSEAVIGAGTMVAAAVIVDPGVFVGQNVILNTGAIICHDTEICDHVHLSPGCVCCGGVFVGIGSHVGAGATILQNVRVGAHAIIGAGAVVTRNVSDGETVVGVPARVIKENRPTV